MLEGLPCYIALLLVSYDISNCEGIGLSPCHCNFNSVKPVTPFIVNGAIGSF